MKLAEYINDMKPDFHKLYGAKYGFEIGQSEAHMDLTLNATTQYLQKLLMSGKMKEIQNVDKIFLSLDKIHVTSSDLI